MKVHFFQLDSVKDESLKYAVVVSRFKGEWILVKHKKRTTWEIPGGKRDPYEGIDKTAERELFEETGATSFTITPVCIYSVQHDLKEESFGMLFYSEVSELGKLPNSEIGELRVFNHLPSQLTYPEIQPLLFNKVLKELEIKLS
ncbi:8-oxo-dGTP diphosphatase [Paenibacillus turicensis]|uniref:8-oxo-dGTP diphosphatase n=1 Tax=Paenibacillus turicensis TaxID=160487 RepID=A0ABS4FPQ0_9BACL|nr:NUDIX domain-containing protein [Paenibacillus turicensis]MBP1904551.1 8-oxo-dGTP diphosphatase [Paenibacillus turicensis]